MPPQYYPIEPGILFGGEYPGDRKPKTARTRLLGLLETGIHTFIDLTTAMDGMVAPLPHPKLEVWRGWVYRSGMLMVHVHVHVKPECLEAFAAATLINARASRQEPGVVCFDVLRQADDPARFVLVEGYRDAAAQAAHKETDHYPVWRDTVAPMMAEPRTSVKYDLLSPAAQPG